MSLDYYYYFVEVEVILDGIKFLLEELEKSELGLYLVIKIEIFMFFVILLFVVVIVGVYVNVDEYWGVWKVFVNVDIYFVICFMISINNNE